MHRQYASQGLAAVSVSLDELDEPSPPKVQEKVLRFLRTKNADLQNFILDEKPKVWQEKLQIEGPPCVYVFDREGKQVKQFKDDFKYADVEKLAVEALKK